MNNTNEDQFPQSPMSAEEVEAKIRLNSEFPVTASRYTQLFTGSETAQEAFDRVRDAQVRPKPATPVDLSITRVAAYFLSQRSELEPTLVLPIAAGFLPKHWDQLFSRVRAEITKRKPGLHMPKRRDELTQRVLSQILKRMAPSLAVQVGQRANVAVSALTLQAVRIFSGPQSGKGVGGYNKLVTEEYCALYEYSQLYPKQFAEGRDAAMREIQAETQDQVKAISEFKHYNMLDLVPSEEQSKAFLQHAETSARELEQLYPDRLDNLVKTVAESFPGAEDLKVAAERAAGDGSTPFTALEVGLDSTLERHITATKIRNEATATAAAQRFLLTGEVEVSDGVPKSYGTHLVNPETGELEQREDLDSPPNKRGMVAPFVHLDDAGYVRADTVSTPAIRGPSTPIMQIDEGVAGGDRSSYVVNPGGREGSEIGYSFDTDAAVAAYQEWDATDSDEPISRAEAELEFIRDPNEHLYRELASDDAGTDPWPEYSPENLVTMRNKVYARLRDATDMALAKNPTEANWQAGLQVSSARFGMGDAISLTEWIAGGYLKQLQDRLGVVPAFDGQSR